MNKSTWLYYILIPISISIICIYYFIRIFKKSKETENLIDSIFGGILLSIVVATWIVYIIVV